ncbi:LysR family transcriptional regulator [Duganella dendranthematis]|jgi:DNA-binding transcriptional LysR family regulator|uniref:LysR family transcriptional regulator n=1 Tax=Duganella dendranthematis TaxID=2728021 RepID=A0ABX6MI61_9BURK|nr:LysR family transcriptional regulator [Duganella dendranthematis]QJD93871.1 LysR family transcriptional regulator [Duganella dendranthematis]
MEYENFNDLLAFVTVAREGSFTKAAKQLGVSQSALSHTIRGLETRLGIRLLTRTTRSVSPTEAGERLLNTAAPRFDEITQELASLNELRDKPAGTIRITAAEHAANNVLWPKLSPIMHDYPDVKIDINVDYSMTNIVSQRFDAGVRLGDQVEKDMIAVRIGPDLRMAVVATPEYFAKRGKPRTPQDLQQHSCINLRLPTHGNLQIWEFEKNGTELNVRVDGQWVFNNTTSRLRAALAGYGLAYVPEDMVCDLVKEGTLIRVMKEWCPTFPGYHLYYPSRRQSSSAFQLVVDALRL